MYKKPLVKKYFFMSKMVEKIWPNKNSRLRFFFFRRYFHKKRFSVSKIVRKFFVLRNMKWRKLRKRFFHLTTTQANKLPYPTKYKEQMIWYKYIFIELINEKKKFRAFYSIKKHKQLLALYRKYFKKNKYYKKTIFLNSFESKLDIVLLRSKILPTLFSCRFLIQNYGVLINGVLYKNINYRLKVGDIIHFDFILWRILISFFYYKIFLRYEIFFFYMFYKKISAFSSKEKKKRKKNYLLHNNVFRKISPILSAKNLQPKLFKNNYKKRLLRKKIKQQKIAHKLDVILGFNLFEKKNHFKRAELNKHIFTRYEILKKKYKSYWEKQNEQ